MVAEDRVTSQRCAQSRQCSHAGRDEVALVTLRVEYALALHVVPSERDHVWDQGVCHLHYFVQVAQRHEGPEMRVREEGDLQAIKRHRQVAWDNLYAFNDACPGLAQSVSGTRSAGQKTGDRQSLDELPSRQLHPGIITTRAHLESPRPSMISQTLLSRPRYESSVKFRERLGQRRI